MTGIVPDCPCGSQNSYTDCCHRLHCGLITAESAEQLMRSRYSAYKLGLADYLFTTTHPVKQSTHLRQSISDWAEQVEFYRLEILSSWRGQASDKIGKIEFIAHYRQQNQELQLRELSRFKRYRKQWVYLDGEIKK